MFVCVSEYECVFVCVCVWGGVSCLWESFGSSGPNVSVYNSRRKAEAYWLPWVVPSNVLLPVLLKEPHES